MSTTSYLEEYCTGDNVTKPSCACYNQVKESWALYEKEYKKWQDHKKAIDDTNDYNEAQFQISKRGFEQRRLEYKTDLDDRREYTWSGAGENCCFVGKGCENNCLPDTVWEFSYKTRKNIFRDCQVFCKYTEIFKQNQLQAWDNIHRIYRLKDLKAEPRPQLEMKINCCINNIATYGSDVSFNDIQQTCNQSIETIVKLEIENEEKEIKEQNEEKDGKDSNPEGSGEPERESGNNNNTPALTITLVLLGSLLLSLAAYILVKKLRKNRPPQTMTNTRSDTAIVMKSTT